MDAARMFPKSVAAARAAGLERIFCYSGHEKTHAGDGGAGMFLTDLNRTVRLGAVPLAVAVSLLEGRRYVRQDQSCPGLVDLRFAGRGAEVRMLWSVENPIDTTVPSGTSQILNMWGRPVKVEERRLRVGQNPVYLLFSQR
jgi:hypothetical protein